MAFIAGSGLLTSSNDSDDRITGASSSDTVAYTAAASAVNISLSIFGSQNTGESGFDDVFSIKIILGSNFNDTLQGNGKSNISSGAGGQRYCFLFKRKKWCYRFPFDCSAAENTGGAGIDLIIDFKNLIGSRFKDTVSGSNTANSVLVGGSGNDVLIGTFGNDILDGGLNSDVAIYTIFAGPIILGLLVLSENAVQARISCLVLS